MFAMFKKSGVGNTEWFLKKIDLSVYDPFCGH